jgi:hypothetical protein
MTPCTTCGGIMALAGLGGVYVALKLGGAPRKPHQYRLGADGGCFASALTAVRNFGGVLEHPKDSQAWNYFGLLTPPPTGGWIRADSYGGWTGVIAHTKRLIRKAEPVGRRSKRPFGPSRGFDKSKTRKLATGRVVPRRQRSETVAQFAEGSD